MNPAYTLLRPTAHYRVIGGQIRRDYVARRSTDGALRIVSVAE